MKAILGAIVAGIVVSIPAALFYAAALASGDNQATTLSALGIISIVHLIALFGAVILTYDELTHE